MSIAVGIDYASVDNNAPPNFTAAKRAGTSFAIPRAIYGRPLVATSRTPFRDPVWARDKDAIAAAGLKKTAYLFVCYERKGVFTPSPEEQVKAFIDYVKLDRNHDLVPMFDVEEESDVLTASEMYDWTLRICYGLRDHYGSWPGMYTSARVWSENFKDLPAGDLINCPLWLAKPWPWSVQTVAHTDGALNYSPNTISQWGNQWFFYQYQGDAICWPGFNKTVDANRFRTFGKGAKGDHVRWIQSRLGITVDGNFGLHTEASVKDLQSRNKLYPDGIVGPLTFVLLSWLI